MNIEYKVRPITRYIVTRFHQDGDAVGCDTRGEYDNADTAYDVAYALCKLEHEQIGYPAFDDRIQYPRRPNEDSPRRAE